MLEAALLGLLTLTGYVVCLAYGAVRWHGPRRFLLVGLSVPLSILCCIFIGMMLINPQWPANPAWHRGMATGFGPDWICNDTNQRGKICVRRSPEQPNPATNPGPPDGPRG